MILDWSDHCTRRAKLPDGRTAHFGSALILVCDVGDPEDVSIPAVTKWVESREDAQAYTRCSTTLGDLLVWAARREPASRECTDCEKMIRPLVPQRVHHAWFNRALVFELLQPWVQLPLPASAVMRLELAKDMSQQKRLGSLLTIRCDDAPNMFTSLMSVLAPDEKNAGTDPFEPQGLPIVTDTAAAVWK